MSSVPFVSRSGTCARPEVCGIAAEIATVIGTQRAPFDYSQGNPLARSRSAHQRLYVPVNVAHAERRGRPESELDWASHSWLHPVPCPEAIDRGAASDFAYATDAGMVSSISVPELSLLETVSLPPTPLARSCMPAKPKCPCRPPSARTF